MYREKYLAASSCDQLTLFGTRWILYRQSISWDTAGLSCAPGGRLSVPLDTAVTYPYNVRYIASCRRLQKPWLRSPKEALLILANLDLALNHNSYPRLLPSALLIVLYIIPINIAVCSRLR